MESVLTKSQKKVLPSKFYAENGTSYKIKPEIRYDDECNNGHNSFSITASIYRMNGRHQWVEESGGCLHEEVAKHFPELAPLIKWHLCSSDGPMYYIANTVYHASDKDHSGRAAGEPSAWEYGVRFNGVPITHRLPGKFYKFVRERHGTGEFQVIAIAHAPGAPGDYKYSPNYTFVGFGEKWHECPFRDQSAAEQMALALNTCTVEFIRDVTEYSTGKIRELDHARGSAIWPEATDDELTAPGLKERLEARLPKLLEEFRAAVESLGFVY